MNFRDSSRTDDALNGAVIAIVTVLFVWSEVDTQLEPGEHANGQAIVVVAPASAG